MLLIKLSCLFNKPAEFVPNLVNILFIDLRTFARSKSIAFMSDPWKYLTLVCCLFKSPSNSKSGSALRKRFDYLPCICASSSFDIIGTKADRFTGKKLHTCEEIQLQHPHHPCLHEENP